MSSAWRCCTTPLPTRTRPHRPLSLQERRYERLKAHSSTIMLGKRKLRLVSAPPTRVAVLPSHRRLPASGLPRPAQIPLQVPGLRVDEGADARVRRPTRAHTSRSSLLALAAQWVIRVIRVFCRSAGPACSPVCRLLSACAQVLGPQLRSRKALAVAQLSLRRRRVVAGLAPPCPPVQRGRAVAAGVPARRDAPAAVQRAEPRAADAGTLPSPPRRLHRPHLPQAELELVPPHARRLRPEVQATSRLPPALARASP
jgi:hypothetical protein